MFVQYFGMVQRPFDEVDAALATIGDGLGDSAAFAYRRGEELLTAITGPAGIAKTVQLELGDPLRWASKTTVPLSWTATGPSGLFPTMDADLTITDLGEGLTQVAFHGRYQPPLGPIGRVLDRAVLHRFAEESVRDFVDRVVAVLSEARSRR